MFYSVAEMVLHLAEMDFACGRDGLACDRDDRGREGRTRSVGIVIPWRPDFRTAKVAGDGRRKPRGGLFSLNVV